MLKNRSAPYSRFTPVLTVSDVAAATSWYARVFGLVEHVRIGTHRAQLGLPNQGGELIVAEVRPGRRVPNDERSHQIMHKVEDVHGLVERAVAQGAKLVDGPTDWEYGERQATVDDPFGHQWVLTQTLVDTEPESWGGESIHPR